MEENKSLLLKMSMSFGLAMGVYWVIKYFFFIWGFSSPILSSVYWGFTLAVIVIAYHFTNRYRMIIGGSIKFFHAWQFGILLYFFAALIVSLAHYIFYRYMAPPDLLSSALNQTIEMLTEQGSLSEETIEAMSGVYVSPIKMAIQGIFNNILYGIIFSLPVALLVARKKDMLPSSPSNTNNME